MGNLRIRVPELCVVAMVGATSAGKTTFAREHFLPTEVLSSDFFRAMVSDDENDQSVSSDAFELLYSAAAKRLSRGKLTVIDATNAQERARQQVLDLARSQDVQAVAIVLDLPEETMLERNLARPERRYPEQVVRRHVRDVKRSIRGLRREGFRYVYVISSPEQASRAEIVRTRLKCSCRDEHGPFDIIGDVCGCCTELEQLLEQLGWRKTEGVYVHPDGRKAVFLGNFCGRGPRSADALRLVMDMVKSGSAMAVPGSQDVKLAKYLRGSSISRTGSIAPAIAEMDTAGADFRTETAAFLEGLPGHLVLDGGKLVAVHAGMREEYIGRTSSRVRNFCIYGDTGGGAEAQGQPRRRSWAADYRGRAVVVYGHDAGKEVRKQNGTYCINTGCVSGGKLTAMRWPEREFAQVPALRRYCETVRPLQNERTSPAPGLGPETAG